MLGKHVGYHYTTPAKTLSRGLESNQLLWSFKPALYHLSYSGNRSPHRESDAGLILTKDVFYH